MSEIGDVVEQVQKYIRALPGMKAAPTEPPDQISVFPFSICWPLEGVWTSPVAREKAGVHNLIIEIHVNRKDLAQAVKTALPYGTSVPNVLYSKFLMDKWGSTIDAFGNISYKFGQLDWNGTPTLGWHFVVERVHIQSTIT